MPPPSASIPPRISAPSATPACSPATAPRSTIVPASCVPTACVCATSTRRSAGTPAWTASRPPSSRSSCATCRSGTSSVGIVLPFTDPRAHHVFHQYVIRVPRRDALRQYLSERKIGSEIYYPIPLHEQTSLASLGYLLGDFPV